MMKNKLIHNLIILLIPGITTAQVVNISNGMKLVAEGNISLVVDNAGMKNDGSFIPANSTVYFSGAGSTAISGSQPTNFYNLIFQGTGTKLNAGNASVINTVGVEGTTVFDADGSLNDKAFTIMSSDTLTGRVDILTTGNISGNVTVERFINTGTGPGQHPKSWQFLATATTGQTYFQSWQESGTTPTGYGTIITGTGTGFDITTFLPSVKYYDEPSGTWTGITNTGSSLQNKLGYMLFVRGDRTVTTSAAAPNKTNMRSKGVLFTPFNPPPSIIVPANRFQTFGNPYASRIEFNKVYLASTGINNVFYVWDPLLSGTYGLGGYQTISAVAGYIPTAGSSTTYYPAGIPSPYIESGQAVFVKGNGTGGNVNFNENCKATGNRLVNKGQTDSSYFPENREFLFATLFTNSGVIADGNIVAFENGFGNEVNGNDALKIMNPGENFGIMRDGSILAVEARDLISMNDTIFYYLKNLKQQTYQFRFNPVSISSDLTARLIDRFNNSSTVISLTDSSFIDFTITADAGSSAADRFILVFKQAVVVPVLFVSINAVRNADRSNQINWKVYNELNLQKYSVERSANGVSFNSIGEAIPSNNNGGSAEYGHRDGAPLNGDNFYRIKAVSINGQVQYSAIAKVDAGNDPAGISIYPNPVIDKTIYISFKNQKSGNYKVQLTNKPGQLIYNTTISVDQRNFIYTMRLGNILAAGTYQLSLIKDDGTKTVEQLVVK